MHKNISTTDHKVSADALVESSREPVREIFALTKLETEVVLPAPVRHPDVMKYSFISRC